MLSETYIIEKYLRPLSLKKNVQNFAIDTFDLLDDAAYLQVEKNGKLVFTVDTLIEGVHFFSGTPYTLIARKALRVTLSDLAAKGATPIGYLLSISWPQSIQEEEIKDFCTGLKQDQSLYQVSLLGGDTTRMKSESLVVTLTAIGETKNYISRLNAKEGDNLYVTGHLGEAAFGYYQIQNQPHKDIEPLKGSSLEHYYLPKPRLGLLKIERTDIENMISCMDVSDGLLIDAQKMARASQCQFIVHLHKVPLTQKVKEITRSNPKEVLKFINFGDDYELLISTTESIGKLLFQRAKQFGFPFKKIGAVQRGEGIKVLDNHDRNIPIESFGYDHFPGS